MQSAQIRIQHSRDLVGREDISNIGGARGNHFSGAHRRSVGSQRVDDIVCKHALAGRDKESSTNRLEDCTGY